jgi:hypothetical protein
VRHIARDRSPRAWNIERNVRFGDKQLLPEAPVGHRQPRTDQVPSEQNLTGDPNDPINCENAALDRMVKGICRGCYPREARW